MLGISFVLLNNVFGHLGMLSNWTPWMVAAAPGPLFAAARWPPSPGWFRRDRSTT